MPSSISHSNDRLPGGPWGRTWLVTLLLAVGLASGVELYWRAQGHRTPMIVDDMDEWSIQRQAASTGDPRTLAVIGMSRTQMGFHTPTFRQRFPQWRLANLPVQGLPPLATLRDLAGDENFRGVVLCEINEDGLLPDRWEDQQPYVKYYHESWRFDKHIARLIANGVQSSLVMVNPSVNLRTLVNDWIEGSWPRPNYLLTFPDRSRQADFALADLNHLRQFIMGILINGQHKKPVTTRPAAAPDWPGYVAEFEKYVQQIQSRGGKVAFVRFPNTGPAGQADSKLTREQPWDVLARHSSALVLRADDVPSLAHFQTPDWSHLDHRDAPIFTGALLDELVRRGVMTP